MTTKQMKRLIQELRRNRTGWLEIMERNPDSIEAAQHILAINTDIRLLNTLRYGQGDYSPIDEDD